MTKQLFKEKSYQTSKNSMSIGLFLSSLPEVMTNVVQT